MSPNILLSIGKQVTDAWMPDKLTYPACAAAGFGVTLLVTCAAHGLVEAFGRMDDTLTWALGGYFPDHPLRQTAHANRAFQLTTYYV